MPNKLHLRYVGSSRKDSYKISPRSQNDDPEEQNTNERPNYNYQKQVYRSDLQSFHNDLGLTNKKKQDVIAQGFANIDAIEHFRSHYVTIDTFGRIPNFFIKDFKYLYKSAEFKYYSNFNRQVIIHMNSGDLQSFLNEMGKVANFKPDSPDFIDDYRLKIFKLIKRFSYYSVDDRLKEVPIEAQEFLLQFFQLSPSKKDEIIQEIRKDGEGVVDINEITPSIYKLSIGVNDPINVLMKYVAIFDDIQIIQPSAVDVIADPNDGIKEKSSFNLQKPGLEDTGDLPLVGIIDSGISENRTILNGLVDTDRSHSYVDKKPFIDSQDHGTGVASLVIFGDQIHIGNEIISPDAKVVSFKILSSRGGKLQSYLLSNIIKEYYEKGIRIYNMSVNLELPKHDNQKYEQITYMLDYVLSYYRNVLFFVSAGNVKEDDLEYLKSKYGGSSNFKFDPGTNICVPGDSTNAISVGSISMSNNISEFSRKNSLDYGTPLTLKKDALTGVNRITTAIGTRSPFNYKPDYVFYGENIKMLSSDFTDETKYDIGTSFSTPLICNVACRLLKVYPKLSGNAVKAILLNASSCEGLNIEIDKTDGINLPDNVRQRNKLLRGAQSGTDAKLQDKEIELIQQRYTGFGKISDLKAIYSSDKRLSILIEDSIKLNYENIYEINIPDDFVTGLLDGAGFIKIKGSISYNHIPILSDHLNYNPIHMSFRLLACSEQELKLITDKIKVLEKEIGELSEGTPAYDEAMDKKNLLEDQKDKYVIKIGGKPWSQDNYYWNQYANNQSAGNDRKISKKSLRGKLDKKLFVEIRCNIKSLDTSTNIFHEIRDYIFDHYKKIVDTFDDVNYYIDQFFGFCLTLEDLSGSGYDLYSSVLNANEGILEVANQEALSQAEVTEEIEIEID